MSNKKENKTIQDARFYVQLGEDRNAARIMEGVLRDHDRLREALIEAMTVLEACDCFDDTAYSYRARCRALDIVADALQEDRDDA